MSKYNLSDNEIHPSFFKRKIIHIDLDAFFAAVEQRENPKLQGKPIIVGGKPGRAGIVSTASYEARKFGIKSAMPSSLAAKLCPNAIFLSPNFELYKTVSKEVFSILKEYSNTIETMSIDEAYLDVSSSTELATTIAEKIRIEIFSKTKLNASAGVAPNKMLAKIATEFAKPNGLFVLKPHQILSFMRKLPLKKIPFIGPATEKKLNSHGLYLCSDIQDLGKEKLISILGQSYSWIYEKSLGIDDNNLVVESVRKSFGEERTLDKDLSNTAEIFIEIEKLISKLHNTLLKEQIFFKTIHLKVKYNNFKLRTKSKTLPIHFRDEKYMLLICKDLFLDLPLSNTPVRLLGVSVSLLENEDKCTKYTLFNPFVNY